MDSSMPIINQPQPTSNIPQTMVPVLPAQIINPFAASTNKPPPSASSVPYPSYPTSQINNPFSSAPSDPPTSSSQPMTHASLTTVTIGPIPATLAPSSATQAMADFMKKRMQIVTEEKAQLTANPAGADSSIFLDLSTSRDPSPAPPLAAALKSTAPIESKDDVSLTGAADQAPTALPPQTSPATASVNATNQTNLMNFMQQIQKQHQLNQLKQQLDGTTGNTTSLALLGGGAGVGGLGGGSLVQTSKESSAKIMQDMQKVIQERLKQHQLNIAAGGGVKPPNAVHVQQGSGGLPGLASFVQRPLHQQQQQQGPKGRGRPPKRADNLSDSGEDGNAKKKKKKTSVTDFNLLHDDFGLLSNLNASGGFNVKRGPGRPKKFGDLSGVPSNATLTTLIQGSTVAAGAGGEGGGVGGGEPLAAAMGGTPASAAIPNFRNPSTTNTVIVNPKEPSRVIHNPLGVNPLGVNGGVNSASPAAALNRGPLAAGPLGSGQGMRAHPSAFSPKQPSNQGPQMTRQEKDEAALRKAASLGGRGQPPYGGTKRALDDINEVLSNPACSRGQAPDLLIRSHALLQRLADPDDVGGPGGARYAAAALSAAAAGDKVMGSAALAPDWSLHDPVAYRSLYYAISVAVETHDWKALRWATDKLDEVEKLGRAAQGLLEVVASAADRLGSTAAASSLLPGVAAASSLLSLPPLQPATAPLQPATATTPSQPPSSGPSNADEVMVIEGSYPGFLASDGALLEPAAVNPAAPSIADGESELIMKQESFMDMMKD